MTKHSGHNHPHHDKTALSAEAPGMTLLKIDPVCGMTVDPETATLKAEHGGQTYYFCSAGCRTKFTANPAKYLDPELISAAADAQPKDAIYTCPMHPEIRQVGPGSCPICGMALEPLMATSESGPNHELIDMTRRFWIGLALTVPVFALEMGGHLTGLHMLLGNSSQTGSSSRWPRPSCSGQDGRSSCAAGTP